ncbi:MAG: hypothetical protein JWO70_640 [Betaproteobacteria bacterium]|nr:hypothetical protein [Betaproteobacteria bacterium]
MTPPPERVEPKPVPGRAVSRRRAASIVPHALQSAEWPIRFSFEAYGVGVDVRSNDPVTLDEARRCLPPGARATAQPAAAAATYVLLSEPASDRSPDTALYTLFARGVELARSSRLDALLDQLESDARLTVAEHAPDRVFVHAGVVGWRGRAIVVPGRSFSGKSTLVAELVRAGAEYYSDEYAVCSADGLVHPFAKPLELRNDGERTQRTLDLREIDGVVGTAPLRAGVVLVTRFKRDAVWKPRELTPGAGVLELLNNTVSARRSPESAFVALGQVVRFATVLKGNRGDARETAQALLARLDAR